VEIYSLDIESSALDLRGNLLSVAVVNFHTRDEFYAQAIFEEGLFVRPQAMTVNGISMADLCNPGQGRAPLQMIDSTLSTIIPQGSIAMGRGLGHFDMGFIKKDLPTTATRFHYRVFDIHGYVFGLSLAKRIDAEVIMEDAMEFATAKCFEKFGEEIKRHHARYDAWENIFVLEHLMRKWG
jgi:hypothetical protein